MQLSPAASWDRYNQIRSLLVSGDANAALSAIEQERDELQAIESHVARLEAECHKRLGRVPEALAVLERAAATGTDNFWIYHALGSLLGRTARFEESRSAYRRAHAVVGWGESEKNGYLFTHDYFSWNIRQWTSWFAEHLRAAPIDCLEIGSWQGGSATWLLDKIVSKRGGSLTCIDTFEGSSESRAWLGSLDMKIEAMFDHNVAASGHGKLARKLVGRSQDVLRTLTAEFDFIYLDGAHEAKFVIADAILCWPLLRKQGFLLFDDIDVTFPNDHKQDTGRAVSAFVDWYGDELRVIEKTRQLLVQKVG